MNLIIEQLNALGRDVHKQIHSINWGGCAVYAAMVGHKLSKIHGLDVRCRVANSQYWPDDGEFPPLEQLEAQGLRTNWDFHNNGVYFSHIFIQFELDGSIWTHDAEITEQWHDAPTEDPNQGDKLHPGSLSLATVYALARERREWNDMFDRKRGIPIIRRACASHLVPQNAQISLPFVKAA